MTHPDYEAVRQYALGRLERELSPEHRYHSVAHTRDDVLPAVERLAALEGVGGEALLLLRTAALFHDIGFVERYTDHEVISMRIAAGALPHYGYSPAQIRAIEGLIMATRIPQSPHTELEELLDDADLDLLGRDDFWSLNRALRAERAEVGLPVTDREWYSGQLAFMQSHRYFTASARALRGAGKKRNMETMAALLEECEARNGE